MGQSEISLEEQYKEIFNLDPNETIAKIKDEINELVETKLLKENPTAIYTIQRKGTHLFHPLFNRLIERGFSLNTMRIFPSGDMAYARLTEYKDVILLVDSINTGGEVSKAISVFEQVNRKTRKIFSYISNKEGLKNLIDAGLIEKKNIISFCEVSSKEYEKEFKKLQIYFHARLEPMDPDHVFQMFKTSKPLSDEEFVEIIRECSINILGDKFRFDKDRMVAPENIFSYTSETGDITKTEKKLNLVPKTLAKYLEIERIQMRMKAKNDGVVTFRIMPFCPPTEFDFKKIRANVSCEKILDCCRLKDLDLGKESEEKAASEVYCALCFENYFSYRVMKKMEKCIMKKFKKWGIIKKSEQTPKMISTA